MVIGFYKESFLFCGYIIAMYFIHLQVVLWWLERSFQRATSGLTALNIIVRLLNTSGRSAAIYWPRSTSW